MEETITKRNWITKSEEKQIITAYEGFKGEIIPYGDTNEHMYEITTVRKAGDRSLGLITIMSDYDPEQKELPRILVRHSDANGKRTFTDVWDRDYKGKIYWRFRNPAGTPISDRDYIRELEHKVSAAEGRALRFQREYQDIVDTVGSKKTCR